MAHEISTLHTFTLMDFETTVQNKVKEILLSSLYDTNNLISDVTEEIYMSKEYDRDTLDAKGHDYYYTHNDKGEKISQTCTEYVSDMVQKYFNELLSKEQTICKEES